MTSVPARSNGALGLARLLIWADVPPSGCFGRLRPGRRSDGGFDRCAAATVPSGGAGALGVRAGRDPGLQEGEQSGPAIRFWARAGAVHWPCPQDGCNHFCSVVDSPVFEITKIRDLLERIGRLGSFPEGFGVSGGGGRMLKPL